MLSELKNAPAGLDEIEWRLEDLANEVVIEPVSEGWIEYANGNYRIEFDASELADGDYRGIWAYGDGIEASDDITVGPTGTGVETLSGYPSAEALVAASVVDVLEALTSEQQEALRTEAIGALERHTRQAFTSEGTDEDPRARRIDGSGTEVLQLPRRLISLTAITVLGSSIGTDDVVISEKRDRLSIPRVIGSGSWADRAVAEIEGARPRRIWPPDPDCIVVTGVWGWEECPAAVATAIRIHMEDRALTEAHKLAPTVRAARALGIDAVSQGNLNISLGASEPRLSSRARREVSDLIWRSPIAVAT